MGSTESRDNLPGVRRNISFSEDLSLEEESDFAKKIVHFLPFKKRLELHYHKDWVNDILFVGNEILMTGGSDVLCIVNMKTGKLLKVIKLKVYCFFKHSEKNILLIGTMNKILCFRYLFEYPTSYSMMETTKEETECNFFSSLFSMMYVAKYSTRPVSSIRKILELPIKKKKKYICFGTGSTNNNNNFSNLEIHKLNFTEAEDDNDNDNDTIIEEETRGKKKTKFFEKTKVLISHKDMIRCLCLLEKSKFLVSAGGSILRNKDYGIRIWDFKAGELIKVIGEDEIKGEVHCLTTSSSFNGSEKIICGVVNSRQLLFFDVFTGKCTNKVNLPFQGITSMLVEKNSRMVILGGRRGELFYGNLVGRKKEFRRVRIFEKKKLPQEDGKIVRKEEEGSEQEEEEEKMDEEEMEDFVEGEGEVHKDIIKNLCWIKNTIKMDTEEEEDIGKLEFATCSYDRSVIVFSSLSTKFKRGRERKENNTPTVNMREVEEI